MPTIRVHPEHDDEISWPEQISLISSHRSDILANVYVSQLLSQNGNCGKIGHRGLLTRDHTQHQTSGNEISVSWLANISMQKILCTSAFQNLFS